MHANFYYLECLRLSPLVAYIYVLKKTANRRVCFVCYVCYVFGCLVNDMVRVR